MPGIVVALVLRRRQASDFGLFRGYTIKQHNTLFVTPITDKVLRPKLTKQCLYGLSGAIMDSDLFLYTITEIVA